MREIICKNLSEWFALGFVPYCNTFGKDSLLATLARLGKIYTEKDKNRFQVSGRKALRLFSGDVQEQRPSDFDAEDLRMSKKSRTFAGR